jgi:predicted DNA-binding transcriptional regulator YafY
VAPGFELQSWIKGFLPHVEVLEPESLRDKVASDLATASSRLASGRKGAR